MGSFNTSALDRESATTCSRLISDIGSSYEESQYPNYDGKALH